MLNSFLVRLTFDPPDINLLAVLIASMGTGSVAYLGWAWIYRSSTCHNLSPSSCRREFHDRIFSRSLKTIDICPDVNAFAIHNIHSRFIQIKYDKEGVTLARSFGARSY